MRSKLIKILLAAIVLIIFLFGCSLVASADGYSGTTGNLSWTLDEDGMLTISGNGPMKNYTYNNKTEGDYMDYWSLVTGVTIGDGVTTIGKNAFRGFSNLASIAFSESVESIEENAFMYCTGLGDLTIPGTLKSIGNYAFQFSGLRNLIIEEGVTHLGAAVFYCSSLQSVYFPSSLFYTQGGEFQGCEQLRSATLAEGTEYISEFMFNGCSSLQEVILPDSLIYIGENAFIDCSSLATIHLPKNLTDICGGAFSFCKNLRSITIPENVSSINSGVFAYCSNLSDVTILGSETTLSATFSNCASDFTLHCPVGSKAEAFAISKNIPYDNEISGATVEPLDTTGDAIGIQAWGTGTG